MEAQPSNLTKAEKAQETRKRNREAKAETARAEWEAAREIARQGVIARYGSKEAVRAPANDREQAIIAAGAEFDRRRAAGEVANGERREAAKAWPMPTTYADALAEQAEWEARAGDFEDLGESPYHDLEWRAELITNLVEWEMPLRTVAEIHDRLKRYHDREKAAREREGWLDPQDIEFVTDAVMRDLGAMVEQSGQSETLHVVNVDAKGQAEGEPLHRQLAEEFVAAGYGVNLPCVIRYPNGQLDIGHKVAFTPADIVWLKREMEAGRF